MSRLLLILAFVLAAASAATAEDRSSLWPAIPKATGQAHPEGNEFWRRNHMNLMKHDRDLTVHEGDRQIEASLKGCFGCHAATDEAGQVVTYASEKHFCRACHDFAAVKVDCFMCHRSTPEGVDETAAHAALAPSGRIEDRDGGSIIAYLERIAEGSTDTEAKQ